MTEEFYIQLRLEEIKELVKIFYSEGLEIDSINDQVLNEIDSIVLIEQKAKNLIQIEQKLFYYLINQHYSSYISSSDSDLYFKISSGQTLLQKLSSHLSKQPLSIENSNQSQDTFENLYNQKVQKIYETLSINCFSESIHTEQTSSNSINLKVLKSLLSIPSFQLIKTEEILLKLFNIKLIIFLKEYLKVVSQKNSFFQDHIEIDSDQLSNERSYKIIVTRAYSERVEGTARVYRDKVFTFGNVGQSEYNDRSDSMILIGTNQFCNIVLPSDQDFKLSEISVVIYLFNEQVFIQDLRDEGLSYIKLSYLNEDLLEVPAHEKMYRVDEGTIVNLCRKYDFHIKNISFSENNGKIESSLVIEWIDSPYQNKLDQLKTFHPEKSFKNNFLLGRGGNGISPDIYCLACTSEIARDHLRFYYEDENWYIEDRNSKNFSFVGIKNLKNIEEKRSSEPVSLFLTSFEKEQNRKCEGRASFLIEKTYMFLFMSMK